MAREDFPTETVTRVDASTLVDLDDHVYTLDETTVIRSGGMVYRCGTCGIGVGGWETFCPVCGRRFTGTVMDGWGEQVKDGHEVEPARIDSVLIAGAEFRRVESVKAGKYGRTRLCGSCSGVLRPGWWYCPTCGRRIAWEVS